MIRDGAHQALEELREVIGVLRDDAATGPRDDMGERPQPTLADLRRLIDESRDAGCGCVSRTRSPTRPTYPPAPGAPPTGSSRKD